MEIQEVGVRESRCFGYCLYLCFPPPPLSSPDSHYYVSPLSTPRGFSFGFVTLKMKWGQDRTAPPNSNTQNPRYEKNEALTQTFLSPLFLSLLSLLPPTIYSTILISTLPNNLIFFLCYLPFPIYLSLSWKRKQKIKNVKTETERNLQTYGLKLIEYRIVMRNKSSEWLD